MREDCSRELILYLFNEIKNADYIGVSEYRAQKLLFKLEKELPTDHPLKDSIPYYWYFHGPFSEPLRNELKALDGIYLKQILHNNRKLFSIDADFNPNLDIIDNDIERIMTKLLERDTFFQIDKIVYNEDAPYAFMPLYKFEFLKDMQDYYQSLNNNIEKSDLIEKAIKTCYKCEAMLPFESYYLRFDDIFSRFITNLDLLTRNNVGKYCSKALFDGANETWFTFGYGLRVKHHSIYYNDEKLLEEWDNEFKSNLNSLYIRINTLSEMARNSSKRPEFSESSKKILSSTVGTYLLCDKNG